MSGVVFDPEYVDVQEELRSEVRSRNLEALLDPRFMELATPTGCTRRRASLPWGGSRPHALADLAGRAGDAAVASLAEFVVGKGFTAVLAPTHFLGDGAQDPWFETDGRLTLKLRERLNGLGASDVAIYYPLAVPTKLFFDSASRASLRSALQTIPIRGVWLRIHPFGSDSGHITLQRYILACRDLHSLSLPLVAGAAGNVGLALLAFGAVGGIESGVSSGEKFDFARLTRRRLGQKGFAPQARVYIPALGVLLPRDQAARFFANRSLCASYACHDTACCRRGVRDMVSNPRRHFVFTRMEEVRSIYRVPPPARPEEYLNTTLRPATDKLGRASMLADPGIRSKLEAERFRLDGWRSTLGEMARRHPVVSFSVVPVRRALRQRRALDSVGLTGR